MGIKYANRFNTRFEYASVKAMSHKLNISLWHISVFPAADVVEV